MNKEEYMKRLSYWLKRIIIERDVKQRELAQKVGVSENSLNAYCNGRCIPSAYTLMKICEELKCSYTILGCPNPIPNSELSLKELRKELRG